MNYPDCFRPLQNTPDVCYWFIFIYDPDCIPGEEIFNLNSTCGYFEDFPCPSDGNRPENLPTNPSESTQVERNELG